MPWLPARRIAALCAHREEILRAGNMLASHISRSACRILPARAGALVLWLPDPCIYQKTRARRGKGASLFIYFLILIFFNFIFIHNHKNSVIRIGTPWELRRQLPLWGENFNS